MTLFTQIKQQELEALAAQLASLARELSEENGGCTSHEEAYAAVLARFPKILTAKKEQFVALFLDTRRRIIGHELVSVGTLNATLVHPREVFAPALIAGANSIIVCHNHPSGDPAPSSDDRVLTERLREAGRLLGVQLDDHIIVGKQGCHSFRKMGLL